MKPAALHSVAFLTRPEFEAEVASADIVITHAGVGSVHTALQSGRRPVVIARRSSLGEHVNDHQLQIVQELEATGRVFAVSDEDSLAELLGRFLRGEVESRFPPRPARTQAVSLVGAAIERGRVFFPRRSSRRALLALMATAGRLFDVDSTRTDPE